MENKTNLNTRESPAEEAEIFYTTYLKDILQGLLKGMWLVILKIDLNITLAARFLIVFKVFMLSCYPLNSFKNI